MFKKIQGRGRWKGIMIIAIGIIGIVAMVVTFTWRLRMDKLSTPIYYLTQEYSINNEEKSIEISYPQITGFYDTQKEKRINLLIKEDIMKLSECDDTEDKWVFCMYLDYEVKFISNKLISIVYKGFSGPSLPGRGFPNRLMATTIDIEEEKVLTINDVISDYEALNLMMLEDQFYNTTMWDGIAGQHKISEEYRRYEEKVLEHLLEGSDNDMEWYTDGRHFIIVTFMTYYYYNEYSIELNSVKNILKQEFYGNIT